MALQKVVSGVIGDNSVGITQLNVSDGSNGQALTTNGSGTLSFSTISSGLATSGGTLTGNLTMGGMILKPSADGGSIGLNRNPDNGNHVGDSSLRRFQLNGPDSTGGDFIQIQSYNSSGTHQGNVNIQDGLVGIGTTPTHHLHVNSGTTNVVAVFESSDAEATIRIKDNTGTAAIKCRNDFRFNKDEATELMRINSSGNIGFNTSDVTVGSSVSGNSTATPKFITYNNDYSSGYTDASLKMYLFNSGTTRQGFTSGPAYDLQYHSSGSDNGRHAFYVANTETMRIKKNQVLIGTTTNPTYNHELVVSGNANIDGVLRVEDVDTTVALSNAILGLAFSGDNDASNGYYIYMTDGNGAIGSIQAASGTSVSFNTTSDERLKKNIVDASSQLDTIKNIKVREFDWKKNDYHELGVIAQEIQSLVPNAVSEGGDDETKHPFAVDYGKIVPYLIKATQEQQTIIEDLKSRIETLEG